MNEEQKMAEKQNEVLIKELYKEMETELDKEPEEMDTEKIRQLSLLLDRLEGRTELPKSLDKQKFFKAFDKKYGFDFHKTGGAAKKIVRYNRRWKAVAAVIAMIVTVMVANTATAVAIDKSLWQLLKETRHNYYYRTVEKSETETEPEDLWQEEEMFESWEELVASADFPLLNLEYMPEDMEVSRIQKTDIGEVVKISGYFTYEDTYIQILCEYATNEGRVVKKKTDGEFEKEQIGERTVKLSEGDKNKAEFEENGILYIVETNLNMEELKKIVENFK